MGSRLRTLTGARLVFASKILNACLGFVVSVIIARTLLPSGRAEYFLATTLAMGVFTLVNLSLDQAVFWAIAERAAGVRALVRPLAVATLVASAAGSLLYLGLYSITGVLAPVPTATALVGATLLPPLVGRLLLDGVLWATGRTATACASMLATAVLQLTATVALAATGNLTSTSVLIVSGGTSLLGGAPGAIVLYRASRRERPSRPVALRRLTKEGARNHLATVALWGALRLDVLVVGALVATDELGRYTLAVTLSELVLLATDSIALAALGAQSTGERRDTIGFGVRLASRSVRVAAVEIGALLAVSWPAVRLIYGHEWSGTVPVLVAMAPGMIALAYMRPLGPALIREGRALERSVIVAIGAVLNVGLTLVLVSAFGIVGGGVAGTVAYTVSAVALGWRTSRRTGKRAWTREPMSKLLPSFRAGRSP